MTAYGVTGVRRHHSTKVCIELYADMIAHRILPEFYLIFNLAVGGSNAYFPSFTGNRPWTDNASTSSLEFWNARSSQWGPTWTNTSFQIDKVSVWELCTPEIRGWNYVGCYTDSLSSRQMSHLRKDYDNNTLQSCLNYCQDLGMAYAGLQFAVVCSYDCHFCSQF